ncbi:hypothetical protein AB205_0095460 [Aquarana catesbeiana]|uniref:Uncharacterized protein n=1 Tax=Aquarana catesbeiana TaxID=8400 RepID=A0A2G9Q5X0_AQUCT|nr:hypothetical protein AB205_0095460 [Aquarana catesbeiana]
MTFVCRGCPKSDSYLSADFWENQQAHYTNRKLHFWGGVLYTSVYRTPPGSHICILQEMTALQIENTMSARFGHEVQPRDLLFVLTSRLHLKHPLVRNVNVFKLSKCNLFCI